MSRRVEVVFGVIMVVLGMLLLARTLQAGGGAIAYGVVLGTLFVAAGLGRLWLGRGGGR